MAHLGGTGTAHLPSPWPWRTTVTVPSALVAAERIAIFCFVSVGRGVHQRTVLGGGDGDLGLPLVGDGHSQVSGFRCQVSGFS